MLKKREKKPCSSGFRKIFESFNVFTAYRVMQTLQFTSACMHQAGLHINRHVIQKKFQHTHTQQKYNGQFYIQRVNPLVTHTDRQTHISYRHISYISNIHILCQGMNNLK